MEVEDLEGIFAGNKYALNLVAPTATVTAGLESFLGDQLIPNLQGLIGGVYTVRCSLLHSLSICLSV